MNSSNLCMCISPISSAPPRAWISVTTGIIENLCTLVDTNIRSSVTYEFATVNTEMARTGNLSSNVIAYLCLISTAGVYARPNTNHGSGEQCHILSLEITLASTLTFR